MVHLKESSLRAIRLSFKGLSHELQGTRLQAFYNLIQKKGEPLTCEEDRSFNGLMGLQISPGEYVAIKKTSYREGSFFPCAMHLYRFTTINHKDN